MKIDLHIHTSPLSACSYIDPQELIQEARRLQLDGICLTEHQVVWDPDEVDKLAAEAGISIFRGNEFTTNQGDILVFGFYEDIKELLIIQDLREKVTAADGYMIVAHPFRGFKTFGIGQLQLTVEQACKRKVLEFVDAVEIGNGKLSPEENNMARKVAEKLGLPGTGGSDAHRVDEVGTWVTVFEKEIESEIELVQELHAGRFRAVKQDR
ncbi:MAG: PHP domain-containing protein [Deltaproteobacteria bacterium]|nr:PHP domain-containing protein [Deltaproteobacteria bacterium]